MPPSSCAVWYATSPSKVPSPMKQVFKECGCGASYSKAEWGALEFVGVQDTEDHQYHYLTEMRNCSCGSTISTEYRAKKKPVRGYK